MDANERDSTEFILAEGNTYEQREDLKFFGFRWSPANKVWWTLATPNSEKIVDKLSRELDGVRFRWVKPWDPDVRMAV